jgi:hypothetical protein
MLALANMVTSRNPSNILPISDLSPSRGRAKLPKSQQDEDGVCVCVKFGDGACALQAAADQI